MHLMDVARWLLPGAGLTGNLASPRERPGWPSSRNAAGIALLREEVMASSTSCIAAWPQHGKVQGIAFGRVRSGPLAWEISALHVDDALSGVVSEVLDVAATSVAQRGGVRLFLRLPSDTPLVEAARKAGFFPAHQETMFTRSAPAVSVDGARPAADLAVVPGMRAITREDENALFHLYCAAVPAPVRALVGMSREEWTAARPKARRGTREWVIEREGRIHESVRKAPRRGTLEAEMLVNLEGSPPLDPVVGAVLGQHNGAWQWSVPDYQALVPGVLAAHGFQESGQFTVLVRMLAALVPAPKASPAMEA